MSDFEYIIERDGKKYDLATMIQTGGVEGVDPKHFAGEYGWNDYLNAATQNMSDSYQLTDDEVSDLREQMLNWYEMHYHGDPETSYGDFISDVDAYIEQQKRIAAENESSKNKSVITPDTNDKKAESDTFGVKLPDGIKERLPAEIAKRSLSTKDKNRIINNIYASAGSSNYYNQLQPFLFGLDRYNSIRIADNLEFNGPLFITRPRLCLQSSNLRNHRAMAPLDTMEPNSIAFAIRALLDTNLCMNPRYTESYTSSMLFDYRNPFMTPLCNAASSVTGLPDMTLETATTQGGLMTEAQQFAVGGDNLHRGSYDLQITFQDVQYGPIGAIFFYWLEYIRCVTRGYMLAYADDIDQQRINYTVSIYLFNLDPSRKYITRWCKCTGCFPKAFPIGAMMNREYNGARVRSAGELSIPFVCNIVEYMDTATFMDFNTLVTRYCPTINQNFYTGNQMEPNRYGVQGQGSHITLPHYPMLNFSSLPYVTSDPYGMRLEWRTVENRASNKLNRDEINMGLLEMDYYNKSFSTSSNDSIRRLNNYYYPGFNKEEIDVGDLLQMVLSTEGEEPDFDTLKEGMGNDFSATRYSNLA